MHPAGATESRALGVGSGQQVGFAIVGGAYRASLWTGTAASWVNLNPAGATYSEADGANGGRQVGWAILGNGRAGLWSGTAASWVSLHPAGAEVSAAYATDGTQQVGTTYCCGGPQRATLWRGTAASLVDLHAFVPAGFADTTAAGIWGDANHTYVVGWGSNTTAGATQALLWLGPPGPLFPYANCDGSTTQPVVNVLDFACFLNRFAAGDSYANCDNSTTLPVLNILDFACFMNRFAAGGT